MKHQQHEVLFHYTTGSVLKRILEQKAIQPDRTEPDNESEIPTVTFSSDPIWERTRFRVGRLPDGRLLTMGKDLLRRFDGGLFRIVIPSSLAPLDWHSMKEQCGMSRNCIGGIYDFAVTVGARTRDWWATTQQVSEEQWIRIEKMNDEGQWIELADDELPQPSSDTTTPVVEIPEVPVI